MTKIIIIEDYDRPGPKEGDEFEEITREMVGMKVRIKTTQGLSEDWVDEAWCPVCEAHIIGTFREIGSFLAAHEVYHKSRALMIDGM